MNFISKAILYTSLIVCTSLNAAPKDSAATAESCRQVSLKLDWLGRYQDRESCTKNLDGLPVYIASQYIVNKKYSDAKALLINAVYQVNFAIDISCYGQDDMKSVVKTLNEIIDLL